MNIEKYKDAMKKYAESPEGKAYAIDLANNLNKSAEESNKKLIEERKAKWWKDPESKGEKFNYAIGRYWKEFGSNCESQLTFYCLGNTNFYGTMEEAEETLQYVIEKDKDKKDWQIFTFIPVNRNKWMENLPQQFIPHDEDKRCVQCLNPGHDGICSCGMLKSTLKQERMDAVGELNKEEI